MFLPSDCPWADQHDFVHKVLSWYEDCGLTPEEGWHEAHYPVPRCLGGTSTIYLLPEHHAIQGLLQSEEYGETCIFAWEREFLPEFLMPLYHKWIKAGRIKAGAIGGRAKKPGVGLHPNHYRFSKKDCSTAGLKGGGKGGRKGGPITGAMPWWTNGEKTTRSHECPGPEWRRGRK